MGFTRRNFLKSSMLVGGTMLIEPASLSAKVPKERPWRPAYARLEETGQLIRRIREADRLMENCRLCPHDCQVNRRKGETGLCQAPFQAVVYSAAPHFGEERPIVGVNGSGTIFFSHCNLRCVFCQNWPIAHEGRGEEQSDEDLAGLMIRLQKIGCHNINLVTPTHVVPAILRATRIALKKGLNVPLFYNTSGYERLETLKLLDGIVDIYKPDMKFADSDQAERFTTAADYPEVSRRAVLEMQRQVGVLQVDHRDIALRGLMIRHLVMPNRVAGTEEVIRWIAKNLPKNTYVNIMAQYRVAFRAFDFPEIARGITVKEFLEAMDWAEQQGLTNLDVQSVQMRNIHRRSLR